MKGDILFSVMEGGFYVWVICISSFTFSYKWTSYGQPPVLKGNILFSVMLGGLYMLCYVYLFIYIPYGISLLVEID